MISRVRFDNGIRRFFRRDTRTDFNYDRRRALPTGDLFPGTFWSSYWEYLERYSEARRTLDELRATEDPLLHFLRVRQAAARHSPSSLLLLPVSL